MNRMLLPTLAMGGILAGLQACAHSPAPSDSLSSPQSRLEDARVLLREAESDEAEVLLAALEQDVEAVIDWHVERASRLEAQPTDARAAMRHYEAAQSLMGDDHPRRGGVGLRLFALSAQLDEVRMSLREELDAVEAGAGVTPERAERLCRIGDTLAPDAEAAARLSLIARRRFAAEEYGEALELLRIARVLRAMPAADAVELQLEALAHLRAPQLAPAIAASPADMASPAGAGSPAGTASSAGTASPAGVASPAPVEAASGAAPAAAALDEAQRLFAAGRRFQAFVQLDEALRRDSDARTVRMLRAQLERWKSARGDLVREQLELGEEALRKEQSEAAHEAYLRVLRLDPKNRAARDRLEKIETLWKIQGKRR